MNLMQMGPSRSPDKIALDCMATIRLFDHYIVVHIDYITATSTP